MNTLLKGVAILVTTFYLFYIIKKISNKRINILDYCYIAFYLVQVLPIFIEKMLGVDSQLYKYGIIYKAMLDQQTDFYYSAFLIVCTFLFAICSLTIKSKGRENIKDGILSSRLLNNQYIKIFSFLGMFITIPAIFFAPNIKVYTEYLYLYRNKVAEDSLILIYHYNVMKNLNLIAFCCILYYYSVNKKKENNLWIVFATVLMTWINQKRTMILFLFIGILIIDMFIKNNRGTKHITTKALFFISIELAYFFIYRYFSGKGSGSSFFENYTLYFSRMANTKLAIYDILNGRKMLAFPGESFLYDAFWFVPRNLWPNKPYPYYVYHTAYSFNANRQYLGWGFQTNIWCEFISNVGIFGGAFLAIIFMTIITKISTKSESLWTFLFRNNFFNTI